VTKSGFQAVGQGREAHTSPRSQAGIHSKVRRSTRPS
jgi:hypothetical protein